MTQKAFSAGFHSTRFQKSELSGTLQDHYKQHRDSTAPRFSAGASPCKGNSPWSSLSGPGGPEARQHKGHMIARSEVDDDLGSYLRMPNQVERLRRINPKAAFFGGNTTHTSVAAGPLSWVESDGFQMLSGLVIFGNAIVIGLETDMGNLEAWFFIEQGLLIFFVFELLVKLCKDGVMYFKHEEDWMWNLLDFGIVASGVVDQWGMPLYEYVLSREKKKGGHVGVVFMLMRMLRLLRIVRLFRLVKIVRPLFQLAQGVLEALQGMFWVLVFMIMTLYANAILCTRFIGHGNALPSDVVDDPDIQPIRKMFGTVPDSMFTLFGTMSSWSLSKFTPLFDPFPMLRPLFVLFYIYSAWALLAVMTGVVSENLMSIREEMVRADQEKEKQRKMNITNTLFDLFNKADADGSGSVSRAEFNAMLRDPYLIKLLVKNSNLRAPDLIDLFDWLDHDGGGTITIDEFMTGFKWINDPLTAKSIMKLQERIVSIVNGTRDDTDDKIEKHFVEVMEMCSHPIKKVHGISEQMENLDELCASLKYNIKESRNGMPTMNEMSDSEMTLHAKLDACFECVSRLHQVTQKHQKTATVTF